MLPVSPTSLVPCSARGAGGNGSRIRFSTSGGGPNNINDIFSMFGGAAGQGGQPYGGYGQSPYGNAGGYGYEEALRPKTARTATPRSA